jgi:hypothetical protein
MPPASPGEWYAVWTDERPELLGEALHYRWVCHHDDGYEHDSDGTLPCPLGSEDARPYAFACLGDKRLTGDELAALLGDPFAED